MNSLRICLRVIGALVGREIVTRGGRWKFGYLWSFFEPALYIGMLLAFRTLLGARSPYGEIGIVFILGGLLTIRTALGISRRTAGAITANMHLLTYPQVKTFDTIIARIILETLTWCVTAFFFVTGMYLFAGIWIPQYPENAVAGYLATIMLGACLGFFNAAFIRVFPVWEKVLTVITMPLYFSSAVLFIPAAMPPEILAVIWYNPFLHVVEWVRTGLYLDYTPIFDPLYVFFVSAILLFTGLFINKYYQGEILER